MISDDDMWAGDEITVTQAPRINGLRIPLRLAFRNDIMGTNGPHRATLTQIRPWRASDGRSSLTLNLIFTDVTPHQRRKIEFYNVVAAVDGETGKPIPDLMTFLAEKTGQADLVTFGAQPTSSRSEFRSEKTRSITIT